MTETTLTVILNYGDKTKPGSVGKVVPGMAVKVNKNPKKYFKKAARDRRNTFLGYAGNIDIFN